jgi:[histone H3]-lysine36 N-dimethyltransferase SETMAR
VPRVLTIDQKQQRVDDSEQCLTIFNRNKDEFFRRYITWLLHYTSESNRQSVEWTERYEPNPKREKTQRSAGKFIASVFWYARGIIHRGIIHRLPRKEPDHQQRVLHSVILECLNDETKKKRPHLKNTKVQFHQYNAPCHKSIKTTAKLHELGYELLPYPPYSPDFASSDFFLFANHQKNACWKEI